MDASAPKSASPLPGFWRRGLHTLYICAIVAVMLTVMDGGGFLLKLLYSLCIGMLSWLFIDGGRHVVAATMVHTGRLHPLARHGWPGWGWMAAVIVPGVIFGYTLGTRLADLLSGQRSAVPLQSNWRTYSFSLVISLAAALVATYFFKSREQLAKMRAETENARRVAAEHQLKLLEAQLEPHMLFNTLANLRALIAVDPPRAQAMLDRLIAFLRATLTASRVGMHPLSAEFERLADYLALMQIRMGDRLQVELDLPAALAAHPVPPLLLQPLVENAIKHGLEPHRGGGLVTVTASTQDGRLRMSVRDTGAGLEAASASASDGTGFGTQQVRERLASLYGAAASFSLEPVPEGGTQAVLLLPLQHAPHPQPA